MKTSIRIFALILAFCTLLSGCGSSTSPSKTGHTPPATKPQQAPQEPTEYVIPEMSLPVLDEALTQLLQAKVQPGAGSFDDLRAFLAGVQIEIPYIALFNLEESYARAISLPEYESTHEIILPMEENAFYEMVRNNSAAADIAEQRRLEDADIKMMCSLVLPLINEYAASLSEPELRRLSEKVAGLVMYHLTDFGNAGYDSETNKLGLNLALAEQHGEVWTRHTLEHEVYHLFQSSTIAEAQFKEVDYLLGFNCIVDEDAVNSMQWTWYWEGSAEALSSLHNRQIPETYTTCIQAMDIMQLYGILAGYAPGDLMKLTIDSSLDDFYNYFSCESEEDRMQINAMMFMYEIQSKLRDSDDAFLDLFRETYGEHFNDMTHMREFDNALAQIHTRLFYRNLANYLEENPLSVQEVFALIACFEQGLGRQTMYSEKRQSLTGFYELYVDTQGRFFEVLAQELGADTDTLWASYDTFKVSAPLGAYLLPSFQGETANFFDYAGYYVYLAPNVMRPLINSVHDIYLKMHEGA